MSPTDTIISPKPQFYNDRIIPPVFGGATFAISWHRSAALGPRFGGDECVREDALSARCESVPEPVAGSVIEGNCVAARRGGEQPEVSRQSVG